LALVNCSRVDSGSDASAASISSGVGSADFFAAVFFAAVFFATSEQELLLLDLETYPSTCAQQVPQQLMMQN
jgi:hypothetical protein